MPIEDLLDSGLDLAHLKLATGFRKNSNNGVTNRAELSLARPGRSADRTWWSCWTPVLAAQPLETLANSFV